MKNTLILIVMMLTLVVLNAGEQSEYYFRFELRDLSRLPEIASLVSVDAVHGFSVYAYANDREWVSFQNTGLQAQLLPHPGINPEAKMAFSKDAMREWDSYPTYETYISTMYAFATEYPGLCQIVDAGTTVNGRKILFARISDNVQIREDEPRLMYTSTMHGDETVGFILMLRLIDTLLSGYGSDPRLSNLVNNAEIWINPNANPDGTYYAGNSSVSGARRYNYNSYDLNRNFPAPDGSQYSGQPLQTETQLMMNLGLAERFNLVANFHGGAEVVNYPWDHQSALHVDDAWYQSISRAYATSAQNNSPAGYLDDLNNGITNGADWYITTGNRQDWTNYAAGGREVTIEISSTKNPAASTLPDFWNYNRDALLGYLEQGLYGIHGQVRDVYGNPLAASITVLNHDDNLTDILSNALGNFYRYLSPGAYDLLISCSGYDDILLEDVIVSSNVATFRDIVFGTLPYEQDINLQEGWNEISLNVMAAGMLPSVIPNLLQVKSISLSYNPTMPMQFNTLSALQPGTPYWVKVSQAGILNFSGTLIPNDPIPLKEGWNFVAYLPEASLSVSSALASISAHLLEVRCDDPLFGGSAADMMMPGKAYWIRVDQDCALQYP